MTMLMLARDLLLGFPVVLVLGWAIYHIGKRLSPNSGDLPNSGDKVIIFVGGLIAALAACVVVTLSVMMGQVVMWLITSAYTK